jgi:arsenical pump membrane protein
VGCLVITAVLSLDTTAVLMVPVAISMARRAGRDPLPFAVTCVWLANTGSLLLPVSNLTNLLSTGSGSPLTGNFTSHTWPVAISAAVVTLVLIVAFWPGVLRGRYVLASSPEPRDVPLVWVCGAVCLALACLFAAGVQPTVPTVVAALILAVVFWIRHREQARSLAVPWKMALAVLALFVVVQLLRPVFLDQWMSAALGSGSDGWALARVAGVGTVAANAVDNLPAFLALQPAADHPAGMVALLVGVNAGAVVTPWGTLATLLWLWRCRIAGVDVSVWGHVWRSLILAVAVVAACSLTLALTVAS